MNYLVLIFVFSLFVAGESASKKNKHKHNGMLTPYNGHHIDYNISLTDNERLNKGEAVTINTRNGKSGRGVVIQDVLAPPNIIMDKIKDIKNYPKVVPTVKKVDIYSEITHKNGTLQQEAEFSVGISIATFGYFLVLTYEPKYNTYRWTLDYKYTSDFEDNVGHWQVVPHPTKPNYSRVLYSAEVKLFSWIPEFVVTYLTRTALIEANAWVKRESEATAKQLIGAKQPKLQLPDVSRCFIQDKVSARAGSGRGGHAGGSE